ncbi:MAG: Rpp14/Pop5 family protein [Candidatus Woesearchaeota archaeon]
MKPLPSSLREKKRYIAFRVMGQGISLQKAKNAIMGRLLRFIGEIGMAKAGIMFLKDWKDNKGIMKVAASEADKVKASLALVKEITVKSVGVSGTLEKARLKYLNGE